MNTLPFAETNSIVKYNTIFVCHLNNEAKFTTDHRSFGRHKRKWFKNGDHHQRIYYVRRRPFACHRQELIKFITCHIIGIVIEFAHRKNFEFYCIEWYYLMRLLNRVQFFLYSQVENILLNSSQKFVIYSSEHCANEFLIRCKW